MRRFILTVVFASFCAFAQVDQSYLGLYGAFSLPLSDFAADNGPSNTNALDKSGFASVGFGGGVEYSLPLGAPEFQFSGNLSFISHLFSEDKADENGFLTYVNDLEGGTYFLIPILGGIKLFLPLTAEFGLYATGHAGMSVIMEQGLKGEFQALGNLINIPGEYHFEPAAAFTWSTGLGITALEKINLGFRILGTIGSEIDYDLESGSTTVSGERKFDLLMFQLFAGWNILF